VGCFTGLGDLVLAAGAAALVIAANSLLHWVEYRFGPLHPRPEEPGNEITPGSATKD
jgi:hypothetical protein